MHDHLMAFVDGVQKVTLRRPGSDLEVEIPKALIRRFRSRRHFRVQEHVVPEKSAHWYLASDGLAAEPYEGDEIEDARGDRWTILEVNRSELNDTWQCVARMYAVRFGLDEHVDHLRAAYTKSSAGTLQHGYRVVKSGIGARFSAATRNLNENGEESLYALVRELLETETDDALRRADGTIFEIVTLQRPLHSAGRTEIKLSRKDR